MSDTAKQPTLEEFRASRREMTWLECARLLRVDAEYTDCPRAQVYMGSVFIEDWGEDGYDDGYNQGRYVMVLDRDVVYDDDLASLEKRLYDYVVADGGF